MVAGTARRMAGPMMALLGPLIVIAVVAFGVACTPKASSSPSFAPWPPRPRSCGRPATPPGSARPQRQPHLSRRSHDVPMRATWCRARRHPERLRHSWRAHGGRAYGPKRGYLLPRSSCRGSRSERLRSPPDAPAKPRLPHRRRGGSRDSDAEAPHSGAQCHARRAGDPLRRSPGPGPALRPVPASHLRTVEVQAPVFEDFVVGRKVPAIVCRPSSAYTPPAV